MTVDSNGSFSIQRQVVLDTETTGLDPAQGHRIIEIGCIEILNRRLTNNHFHQYLQPDRDIEQGAAEVHGITTEFLADKPRFHDIAEQFLKFIQDAQLIIHNAPFDTGFLNNELQLAGRDPLDNTCRVLDTLLLARQRHPGQKNSLDALCKRYEVDNTQRKLHGALLDAQILADVYLAMTREQVALGLSTDRETTQSHPLTKRGEGQVRPRLPLRVVKASDAENAVHQQYLDLLDKTSGGHCVWKRLENG
jgi:DNA polymerase-3 subunit epsilon